MLVDQIFNDLKAADFAIQDHREVPHGHQIRLRCGATIIVFTNRTVLVQGRLIESAKEESLRWLRRILPPATKWHVK